MHSLTFLDVVVFNEKVTERCLFHGLVHAVQFEVLVLSATPSFSSAASSIPSFISLCRLRLMLFRLSRNSWAHARTGFPSKIRFVSGSNKAAIRLAATQKSSEASSLRKTGPSPTAVPGAALAASGTQISCSAQHPENRRRQLGMPLVSALGSRADPFNRRSQSPHCVQEDLVLFWSANGYANAARRPPGTERTHRYALILQPLSHRRRFFFQIAIQKIRSRWNHTISQCGQSLAEIRDCMALFSTTR